MPAGLRGAPTPSPNATPAAARPDRRDRRWPVSPRLAAAFLLATVFHLSMVTVFRIVVVFPETQAKYCRLQIISEASPAPDADTPPRTGGGELVLRRPLLLAQSAETQVELPTMDFAELDRLRVRSEAGTDEATMNRVFGRPDSWAKFAGGLQTLGKSLRELVLPEAPALPEKVRQTVARHRPAAGYSGEIVWNAEPRDRELLFSPPIPALANAADAGLRWPVEAVLTVNPAGRVINVWCAAVDDAGIVSAIQSAALQYRFAPLPAEAAGEPGTAAAKHMGTLYVRPADGQP